MMQVTKQNSIGGQKNISRKVAPAPICQCECRACDIGIHCGKSDCEHHYRRSTRRL